MSKIFSYLFSPKERKYDAPPSNTTQADISNGIAEPAAVSPRVGAGTIPPESSLQTKAGHVTFEDTSQFLENETCFIRHTVIHDTVEILGGTRVYIVSQVTAHEYLVFSEEHRKHFVCEVRNISRRYAPSIHDDGDVTASDHSSDYERAFQDTESVCSDTENMYPEIEKPRNEASKSFPDDSVMSTAEAVSKMPESTPKPTQSTRVKRKNADSTMITKNDVRRMRRNSLVLYNRKLARARRKLKDIQREISTISEASENSDIPEDTPDKPNPFVKCLRTPVQKETGEREESRSTINSLDDDFDSDDNSSDDDAFDNMASTYVPPSTSQFLKGIYAAKSEKPSKETEAALKHLRQYPEKVPQVNAYQLPIAFFLCRIIYQYAVRQGLHQVQFLNRWVFYAFPEVNQEKVHYYLGRIRSKYPKASLFQTLRELARSLSPDDFMTLQTIQSREESEGLTDLLIRLQSDIPIIMDCTEAELPGLILQFIKNSERDSQAGTEFRREAIRIRGKPTLDKLHKIVSRVDRLVQPSSNGAIPRFSDDRKRSTHNICSICKDEHSNVRDDGTAWPSCESCMYAFQPKTQNVEKFQTYNKPRQSSNYQQPSRNTGRKCRDCDAGTEWNRRSSQYFVRCYDCFQKFKQGQRKDNFEQQPRRSTSNNFGRNMRPTSYANAARKRSNFNRNNINEFRTNRPYDPKCYRVAVRVKNRSKTAEITGLFDTGCNLDVISRKACTELGISHLIKPCRNTASVVDGAQVTITGTVYATVQIGNVPYTSEFSVIEHINGYDMMVGTKFMESSGLLNDIFSATQKKLGTENVTKGN